MKRRNTRNSVSKSITHEYFIHGLLPIVVMGKRKSAARKDRGVKCHEEIS